MVKDLREKTGAGMMDCKAALAETQGDMEAAVDWLRKKGLSKAAKKAGRVAAEGLIAVKVAGTKGVLVEVNSETDFVARNDMFQGLVKMIGAGRARRRPRRREDQGRQGRQRDGRACAGRRGRHHRREHDAAPRRRARGRPGRDRQLRAQLGHRRARQDRRAGRARKPGKSDELTALGRQVAMHVAASNPQAVDPSGLDPAVVAREKDVLADKFRQQGKPENVIAKIVESGLKTFYKEVCLLEQPYIHDDKKIGRAGAQGSRRQGRRPDQGHRLRALRARRGRSSRPATRSDAVDRCAPMSRPGGSRHA